MRIVGFKDICEEHMNLAKQCVGIVEANSFERFSIWEKNSPKAMNPSRPVGTWEEGRSGGMFHVGDIGGRAVNVQFFFDRIDGKWVMFYSPCSSAVDWNLIEEWRKTDMGHAKHTDAMNFHIVKHHISDLNKTEAHPKDLGELADEHPVGRG